MDYSLDTGLLGSGGYDPSSLYDLTAGYTGPTYGLTIPSSPSLSYMGGGTGLTVPNWDSSGGTLFSGGVAPSDYGSSVLYNPSSGIDWGAALSDLGTGLSKLSSPWSQISSGLSQIGNSVGSTVPGMLALDYAARQPGIDTSSLQSILARLGGNQDAIVKAATDPFQANISAGYGDLLQSQAARGIRGSSFGNNDITNFLSTTGTSLANAGANAAEGSLSLQGNLASQIAQLKNQAQLQKNQLYGTAFDVLGRGLNPQGYAGTIYNGMPMGGGGGGDSTGSMLGGLGALAGGVAALFSDKRLKTNIVKLYDDPRGFGVYEFDMFGRRQTGVIADEVEKVIPDAVWRIGDLKVVDYGRLH